MATSEQRGEPTYGNWRRPQSAGLGALGMAGTAVLMAGTIVVIIVAATVGILGALAVLGVLAAGLSTMMVKDRHGRSGIQRMTVRTGWWNARSSGSRLYRSGPLSGRVAWGSYMLPGLLAQSKLSEAVDSMARPFAILEIPSVGHFSVVIATEPEGASLVDQEQVDEWVARWGEWLASLADEPGLVGASVTVETAPDTGHRLRRTVEARLDPNAPSVAAEVLREVVDSYPVGSATVKAWVALTFAASTGRRRRRADQFAVEFATRLPGLTGRLQDTGAGRAQPVSAQGLCELVRTAYDPQAGVAIEDAYAAGQTPIVAWPDVGPAAADAFWERYVHDGASSVSWAMTGAPRGEVHCGVLGQLLAPHGKVDRKRVTLLYRVLEPGVAAKIVEADKRNADFRVNNAVRPSERALRDQAAAVLTAREEARGAALVDFGLVVTATVMGQDPDRLADAEAAVENLAATARLTLRRQYGSQDSAFASGLPLGLVLPKHLNVPEGVRSAL